MVMFASRHGANPADERAPYGHGRYETAASMVLGLILAGVGAGFLLTAGAGCRASTRCPSCIRRRCGWRWSRWPARKACSATCWPWPSACARRCWWPTPGTPGRRGLVAGGGGGDRRQPARLSLPRAAGGGAGGFHDPADGRDAGLRGAARTHRHRRRCRGGGPIRETVTGTAGCSTCTICAPAGWPTGCWWMPTCGSMRGSASPEGHRIAELARQRVRAGHPEVLTCWSMWIPRRMKRRRGRPSPARAWAR